MKSQPPPFSPTLRPGLFLLSAATLAFEINLTRLFSVAQFYHFAFLIVSLALLGFGASGTALAIFPNLGRRNPQHSVSWLALAASVSILGAYLLTNWLPFDSFTVAWDSRQVGVLTLHFLALASPFFFGGMVVGLLLSVYPQAAGQTYAVNLAGSALGCLVALVAPSRLGGEGTVVLSASLAALAGLMTEPHPPAAGASPEPGKTAQERGSPRHRGNSYWVKLGWKRALFFYLPAAGLLIFGLVDLGLRLGGRQTFSFLDLRLSPYKGLSYALQYPGARVIYRRWNAFSRVDVVSSGGIRSLPGLSYLSPQPPPPEHGLLVDGDDLSPVVLPDADIRPALPRGGASQSAVEEFADYMPAAIAFRLRPQAEALILEPRGGLDVLIALSLGARRVTAVEINPLMVEAAGPVYTDSRVRLIVEPDRSYLRRSRESFDVAALSLTTSYHPVRSGAYSLAEDYRYTVEAFEDALSRLRPDGLLTVLRWLQTPPSEELRAFALAVTALERTGGDPAGQIIAFRGYNTGLLLVKKSAFTPDEVDAVRAFAARRAFDLVYAPGIRSDEVNQYNILPEPIYYQTFTALLTARPRDRWYADYPFDVTPPTDDRPFFGQFFKWSQVPQVMAELGKTWQPFGGAGYLILLALLGLATVMATVLIVLPLGSMPLVQLRERSAEMASPPTPSPERSSSRSGEGVAKPGVRSTFTRHSSPITRVGLTYFGLIGLAFLLVEIPVIQRFILFLGHPAYALTVVLFALLLFSSVGSQVAHRIPHGPALALLVLVVLGLPWLLRPLFAASLGFPFWLRLAETVAALAPLGFLMGIPFPWGIRWLEREAPGLIPWAWGVNGAASVVSSVLAALLALSFGFSWALAAGAACYAGAWITAATSARPARRPGR